MLSKSVNEHLEAKQRHIDELAGYLISDQIWYQVEDHVWDYVLDKVWTQVQDKVRAQLLESNNVK